MCITVEVTRRLILLCITVEVTREAHIVVYNCRGYQGGSIYFTPMSHIHAAFINLGIHK